MCNFAMTGQAVGCEVSMSFGLSDLLVTTCAGSRFEHIARNRDAGRFMDRLSQQRWVVGDRPYETGALVTGKARYFGMNGSSRRRRRRFDSVATTTKVTGRFCIAQRGEEQGWYQDGRDSQEPTHPSWPRRSPEGYRLRRTMWFGIRWIGRRAVRRLVGSRRGAATRR